MVLKYDVPKLKLKSSKVKFGGMLAVTVIFQLSRR